MRLLPIPSIVMTFLPAAEDIGVEQDRTGLPSRCTVHAPQSAMPQPNLVPVSCNCSRSAHSSGISASASIDTALPLTDIGITGYLQGTARRRGSAPHDYP